jgi:organic hydroperoxide reductase OsmC/OhrA
MLWFLHLCAEAGVVVTGYTDNPTGIMAETENGGGKFEEVILRPEVTVQNPLPGEQLEALHKKAHAMCFIANSVNFPVLHEASFKWKEIG